MAGNILNFNSNKIQLRLSDSEYHDFYLAKDEYCLPQTSGLNSDCLVAHYDFNESDIFSGSNTNTIYSLATWSGATNTGYTLDTIGLTGIDNGLITFVKPPCDTTNQALLSALTGSTLVIPSGDTRLMLNAVTGMTGQVHYPTSLVSGSDSVGDYLKLCGGFYQGYYKLDGNSYEVLPNRVPKAWTAEFWLKKDKAEPCDVFEVITDMTTASYSQEVTTTLSGHNLTTDDVILVNGAGEPFDTIDGAPFYKILSIIDENTFVYGNRVGSFSDSSEIGYIGRFTEVGSYDSVVFSQNDGVITYPDRWFGSLTGHSFNIGDMLSFDLVSYGGGGGFILVDNYTAYVTGIVNDDLFEVKFGTDSINDSPGIVANITRYIEDGCNKEYEMYSDVEMTKEISGYTITVTLGNHGLFSGDPVAIYNGTSGFTTDKIFDGFGHLSTMGFGVVNNVIDTNTFQFTHHYYNETSKIRTEYNTILLYEEDFIENIFVDDRDTGGNDNTYALHSIECKVDGIELPIRVDNIDFDLIPAHSTFRPNGTIPFQYVAYGYTSPKEILDDEFEYSGDKVSSPTSGYADITFYKPKKKIPLTLNDLYPENKGIFFYMGTRAENKFWKQFEGLNTGSTSGCTGSNVLNTSVNYVTNGDFSSGTEGETPDGWSSSAWLKVGDSAWIGSSGPPTISIPISQDLTTSLSSCSYQLMFNIDVLGSDTDGGNITFSTNLSGISEVFTTVGTGLTYNFDLTDEDTPVSAITFTINGSNYVSGQISNIRIYAFDKANDWCTIPKETDISIVDDESGLPFPVSPPLVTISEITNQFLIYGRADADSSSNSWCNTENVGFGTKLACSFTGDSIFVTAIKEEQTDFRNPFLVFSRAKPNSSFCSPSGSGGTQGTLACNYTGDTTPMTELDWKADVEDNAMAFMIKDDGSIGYRLLTVSPCSGDTKLSGCEIEESFSASGMVKDNEWTNISVRFVSNQTLNDCDLETKGPRDGQLMFYVNCMLKHVAPFDEFIARRLGIDCEHWKKQVGVPYNISLGGGSQGLLESMTFDGQDQSDLGLCIQENFAGTFIGGISQFRFHICDLNWCELKANCAEECERYGTCTGCKAK